ncbi:aldehyde dehydrogenase family protein, partial [Nocardia cyriacigeorgica]|uniref:aldehyde dehydrogenase family protein n=1 Tax=Nocardia cyriacigeorgica TaxID=135487 RepID=UPI0013D0AEAB
LRNGGEACTAANRFHVQRGVVAEFTTKLIEAMSASVTLGPGIDPDTTLGPLITENQLNTVRDLVDDAVGAGATVRLGGKAPEGPGWFYPATILTDI